MSITKGLVLFFFCDPIQIALVFFLFNLRPEITANLLKIVIFSFSDSISLQIRLPSSANWLYFTSTLFGSFIPLLLLLQRISCASKSTDNTYKKDRNQETALLDTSGNLTCKIICNVTSIYYSTFYI